MPKIRLTLACGDYDINRALIDGTVAPRGIDLVVVPMSSPERHWRMYRHQEFDICEISLASSLVAAGHRTHRFTAIPVFPHRRFRHGYVFTNVAAGIDHPAALEGRRVGLRTWQTTAIHWIRGMLRDSYGVNVGSIRYYTQDEEDIPAIWPIERFSVERVPIGRNVDEMLCTGQLDAVFYPETLPSIARGDSRVRRLWADPKAEEIRYFHRTGLFPLMHTVVFRDEVLERHPWAAVEMLQAFRRSKALAFQRMRDPRHISLAWVQALREEQERLLGPDPWPYDLADSNRKHLDLMIRWGVDFGLMPALVEPEALFAPATLDTLPAYVASS